MLRKLLILVIVVPLLLIGGVVGFFLASLQSQPLVRETQRLDTASADKAMGWLRRTVKTFALTDEDMVVSAGTDEINGLMAVASRGIPRVAGIGVIADTGAIAAATVVLPQNPIGRYFNVRAGLLPSEDGLKLAPLHIGGFQIPGSVQEFLLRVGLDLGLGEDGGEVLDVVNWVRIDNGLVLIRLAHDPQAVATLRGWNERLAEVRDRVQLMGDPEDVRVYYRRIAELGTAGGNVPLDQAMAATFQLARERSAGGDPAAENQAAILALGGYFGSYRVLSTVGRVVDDELQARLDQGRANGLLGGREDLTKHFLISAALELLSTGGVSFAIGEMKELLDTRQGGTGFSFVDLAADRAGVRFAEAATDPDQARRVQDLVIRGGEAGYFPTTAGLPEWMSQSQFEQVYGGLDDPRYQAMVSDIDRRIATLPVHGG